ncbi:MAG: hypothetical protein M5U19_02325 [Microthrixaceae bacterium]|nr:hypothetical protein [Microthrixaceae bacterium]
MRLVTSWSTKPEDVDTLTAAVQSAAGRLRGLGSPPSPIPHDL